MCSPRTRVRFNYSVKSRHSCSQARYSISQVTTSTLKILQDLGGESKDFVFKDIRKKDLKDPNVSIALGVR